MEKKLLLGNNLELLKQLEDNSIDSVVTDPPYGLSFMNKKWDYDVPSVEFWKEVLRVLKPGGHVLSFGGTRTYHRMVVNIEDAGFEIRDQIMWLYGSGFPKSLNIGKAIDKIQGNEREEIEPTGRYKYGFENSLKGEIYGKYNDDIKLTKGNSEFEGWGTGLKPANEPIVLARKPISEKTIAENVLRWGTGGINIDGCRIEINDITNFEQIQNQTKNENSNWGAYHNRGFVNKMYKEEGRFPANVVLDEEAAKQLDEQSGNLKRGIDKIGKEYDSINNGSKIGMKNVMVSNYPGEGGASKFFYVSKVSKKERNLGLEDFEDKEQKNINSTFSNRIENGIVTNTRTDNPTKNNHPTVKPINLLTYLCRLITPPNGTILDPYMGSGSSGISALLEGFNYVGMEMEEEYFRIAEGRINNYEKYKKILK